MIDSSCVIALDYLELMPQLSWLYSTVLVPKAVQEELYRREDTRIRLEALFEKFAIFQGCDNYDHGTVNFLLAERRREGHKDRGEVEAVVQAAQFGADVVVDDRWGSRLAARYGRESHGTMWVLLRFHELSLLSASATRSCFASLKERGVRLPWQVINEFLSEIGQSPLP